MILLTGKERTIATKEVWDKHDDFTDKEFWTSLYKAVAKAQLKKMTEWGNQPCEHGVQQKRCVPCWQSLLKEIE